MKLHVHPSQVGLLAQLQRQGYPLDPQALAGLELEVDLICPPEVGYLLSKPRPRDPAAGLLPQPQPGTQLQTYANKRAGWAISPLLTVAKAVTEGLQAKALEADLQARLLEFSSLDDATFSFADAIKREIEGMRESLLRQMTTGTFRDAYSVAFGGRWEPAPPATPEQLAEASDTATPPARLEQLLNAPQPPLRHLAVANESLPGEKLRSHLTTGSVWAWLNPAAWLEATGLTAKQLEHSTREAVLSILARYWSCEESVYLWRRDPLTTTSTLVRRARVATRKRLGGGRSPDELTSEQARAVVETVALVLQL